MTSRIPDRGIDSATGDNAKGLAPQSLTLGRLFERCLFARWRLRACLQTGAALAILRMSMFAKQSGAKWRKKVQAKDPPKGDRNKNGPPNQKKEEEAAQHTNETKRKFTAHEQAKWYKNTGKVV